MILDFLFLSNFQSSFNLVSFKLDALDNIPLIHSISFSKVKERRERSKRAKGKKLSLEGEREREREREREGV